MNEKRAVIFANGEIQEINRLRAILREDDVLIAADGGLRHIFHLGLRPTFLIGDLDSVTPAEIVRAKESGVDIRQYPPAKDETDLQLAIDLAVDMGFNDILITAALGGRLDQTLGNIFLMSRDRYSRCLIRIDDGSEEVFLIRKTARISGEPGDTVSLLPLGAPAFGVRTENLEFPLKSEILYPDRTRGISNVMLTSSARISISSGMLVCIHTRRNTG